MQRQEDSIELALRGILKGVEKIDDRVDKLEADVAEARENAERAARSVVVGGSRTAGDFSPEIVPLAMRRCIELHARAGHAQPVKRAAAEAALKLIARTQLPGQSAVPAAEELGRMKAYLNENTGSMGAYAVPSFVEKELYALLNDAGLVRRRAKVIPMPGKTSTVVNVASNVTTYVVRELGTNITQGEPTLGSATLTTLDYVAYGQATLDVLQDEAVGLLDFFFINAVEQIAGREDALALEGTTTDTVLGLGSQTTTSVYTIGKIIRIDTTTATNSPTVPNITHLAKAAYASRKSGRIGASWFFHPQAWANIVSQASSAVPTFGHGAWLAAPNPSDALSEGTLFGAPVYCSPEIGTATEGAKAYFGAFGSQLVIGDRAGVDFRVSLEEKFQQGLAAMRVIKRTAIVCANPHGFVVIGKTPYSIA